MQWTMVFLLLGLSATLWVSIGTIRYAQQARERWKTWPGSTPVHSRKLSTSDVAVIIPARNEEVTIGATLESVIRLIPARNIHVIADGCDDATAEIAHNYGVNVLVLSPARGKAGGIEAAVQHFEICRKYSVLLILDADTQLDGNYVERGLELFGDPAMGAVAGYAYTSWNPDQLTMVGRFLLAYRTRIYVVMQWIKYGQTWRYTNVTPIVPGFASMYRTNALAKMDLNPPGLVIEDFNMTFELHRKRLGKVAFEPAVFGYTQDPDNLRDYYRQIRRWWLGFWQTVRRHGLWWSLFSAALCVFLAEIFIAGLVLITLALSIILLAADPLSGGLVLEMSWYSSFHEPVANLLTPLNMLLFVFVPDYLLTCAVAVWLRRPSLLVYGVGFLFLRLLDSVVTLLTLQQAWHTKSTGRWNSPRRRAVVGRTPRVGVLAGASRGQASVLSLAVMSELVRVDHQWLLQEQRLSPVIRDMVLLMILLAMAVLIVMVAIPLMVALAAGVLLSAFAVIWSQRTKVAHHPE